MDGSSLLRGFHHGYSWSLVLTRWCQLGPKTERSSCQDFRFCRSEMLMFLVLTIREMLNPDVSMALSSMSAMCPNNCTAVILSLFRESRFHEFKTLVVTVYQNFELRYADLMALGSAATCPLRWTTHNPLGILWFVMSGFCISGFWRAVSFARPTPDP